MDIKKIWHDWNDAEMFSGVFSVRTEDSVVFESAQGFRNRNEGLHNNIDTAFGIASGTKMFTGLAVCKLIDNGKLSLENKLWDILPYDLGKIDKRVTVLHLLTHTSGIGDYIDEEADDSMEQLTLLYHRYPSYLWERLEYYLQMITPLPPKFEPGFRFGYSNAGFVMLGLVVEAVSGMSYQQFVTDEIIVPLKLHHTGFYRMDELPANTALGYVGDKMRTNIFNMPIIGGSDGGLFTCAKDLDALWRAMFSEQVLSDKMLDLFLASHIKRGDGESYGLGVYRYETDKDIVYYAVGCDFGVYFFTAYFPALKISVSALGNTEVNTFPLLKSILSNTAR
jgi:Beta-lactamase class C and other penicillin binding proteins